MDLTKGTPEQIATYKKQIAEKESNGEMKQFKEDLQTVIDNAVIIDAERKKKERQQYIVQETVSHIINLCTLKNYYITDFTFQWILDQAEEEAKGSDDEMTAFRDAAVNLARKVIKGEVKAPKKPKKIITGIKRGRQ